MRKRIFKQKALSLVLTAAMTLGLLVSLADPAFAADINSKATGDWSVAATWNTAAVPSPADNVTILDTHTVTVDGSYQITDLTVNNNGTLVISASQTLTVSGNLVVNGGTLTNNGTLNIAGNSVVNGTLTNNGALTVSGNLTG
ncbi:MAG: G8 domain-containing protein [Actinomycetota bacterium]|nr:G8 domain-containing protein [Actinomycetota bacterium]